MSPSILVYGYGNPGRQDDALGVLFAESLGGWVEEEGIVGVTVDTNYQLAPEDVLAVSAADVVIFADASEEESVAHFAFGPLASSATIAFTTHAMSPESVLALCEELYGAAPRAFLMRIRGRSWEPGVEPTAEARENLRAAREFVKPLLRERPWARSANVWLPLVNG